MGSGARGAAPRTPEVAHGLSPNPLSCFPSRCPKAALQRGVPGRRPVATPVSASLGGKRGARSWAVFQLEAVFTGLFFPTQAGSGCQPLRLRASFGAPRLVLRG